MPLEQVYLALAAGVADEHRFGPDKRHQPVDVDVLGQQVEHRGIGLECADAALPAHEPAEQRREVADIGADLYDRHASLDECGQRPRDMGFPGTIENETGRKRQITGIDKQPLAADGRRQHSAISDIHALRHPGPATGDSGFVSTKCAEQGMHRKAYKCDGPGLERCPMSEPESVYGLPARFAMTAGRNGTQMVPVVLHSSKCEASQPKCPQTVRDSREARSELPYVQT